MSLNKEQLLGILHLYSQVGQAFTSQIRFIDAADFDRLADKILSEFKSHSDPAPPLQQADVMRPLPPILPFVELALNTGQAELRSMYKRVGIKGSNVLDLIDETLEKVQAAMSS